MRKTLLFLSLLVTLALASNVNASIQITPTSGTLTGPPQTRWELNNNNTLSLQVFRDLVGVQTLVEQYKATPGSADSGPLAGSYSTSFTSTTGVSGGSITYSGSGNIVAGTDIFLLVKDGNEDPSQYIFKIDEAPFSWNGTEEIVLSGFWPGNGSISHITIYSNGTLPPPPPGPPEVPEPATLAMWGLGLGVAGLIRLRSKK